MLSRGCVNITRSLPSHPQGGSRRSGVERHVELEGRFLK